MKVGERHYRAVWADSPGAAGLTVRMIEQRLLPHRFEIVGLESHMDTARAIRDMVIRGAPSIGAAAAYGMAQAAAEAPPDEADGAAYLREAKAHLAGTRPTAFDLFDALDHVAGALEGASAKDRARAALEAAEAYADRTVERCRRIGEHGAALIPEGGVVLTHCNAGWLATLDWGTALAPVYAAHRAGVRLSVLADETRPRMQGANLTAWELAGEGVDYRIAADNAAGLLMRRGEIALAIVGADRIAANGDAANKIGTCEKALLAREHGIPFYVAAPSSTFDPACPSGDSIPIEERSEDEVLYVHGIADDGTPTRVRVAPPGARARNPAFDVTPASWITGYITEHGVLTADQLGEALARRG